jgi:hypothetical protein
VGVGGCGLRQEGEHRGAVAQPTEYDEQQLAAIWSGVQHLVTEST